MRSYGLSRYTPYSRYRPTSLYNRNRTSIYQQLASKSNSANAVRKTYQTISAAKTNYTTNLSDAVSGIASSVSDLSKAMSGTDREKMYDAAKSFVDSYNDMYSAVSNSRNSFVSGRTSVMTNTAKAYSGTLEKAGVESLVLFPLVYNDETLGYIWAVNFEVSNADHIKEILEYSTHLIASEIANYQHVNRLRLLGMMDILTDVYNRNAMNNRVNEFVRSPKDLPDRYGVVAADLNGLKTVNDTEGHKAGDALLTAAADILKRLFDGCEIYRAGGDEFMIFALDMPEEKLSEITEKLRADSEDPDNISFAVGMYYDNGSKDICLAMQKADKEMYKDKDRYYQKYPDRRKR